MEALIKCTLDCDSGISADSVTNTFIARGLSDLEVNAPNLVDCVNNFYNGIPTGGLTSIASQLSPTLNTSTGHLHVSVYDITSIVPTGGPMGSPIYSEDITLATPAAGNPLPSEVAFVVQLRATGRALQPVERPDGSDPGTAIDRPKQRYTGRIYLGPLNVTTVDLVSGVARPHSSLRDTARLAIQKFTADLDLMVAGARLGVWSRVDKVVRAVDEVATDNAFDTQRRRGEKPTIVNVSPV